jgi:hypothetical protein
MGIEGSRRQPARPLGYPARVVRGAIAATALTLVAGAVGAAAAGGSLSYAFGRKGGNIEPFTVVVNADGSLDATGAIKLSNPRRRVSSSTLATLLKQARSGGFYSPPRTTLCPGSLPDFASFFVTIRHDGTVRTVSVRGGCRPGFQALYTALSRAAGVR